MPERHMSDIAGRLFPASFVGSYPRPSWYGYNLGGRDVLEAMRDEEFAEAYRDGIRAMIGDQEEVGLDVAVDGHLWYDKHQGFIGSFALYNGERFDGSEIRQSGGRMLEVLQNQATDEGTAEEWSGMMEVFEAINSTEMVITGKLGRGALHHAHNWRIAQNCTIQAGQSDVCDGPRGAVDDHGRRALPGSQGAAA